MMIKSLRIPFAAAALSAFLAAPAAAFSPGIVSGLEHLSQAYEDIALKFGTVEQSTPSTSMMTPEEEALAAEFAGALGLDLDALTDPRPADKTTVSRDAYHEILELGSAFGIDPNVIEENYAVSETETAKDRTVASDHSDPAIYDLYF